MFCRTRLNQIFNTTFSLVICLVLGAFQLFSAETHPKKTEQGLLFYLSGDQGFKADYSAGGKSEPNYLANVDIIKDGAKGPGDLKPKIAEITLTAPPGVDLRDALSRSTGARN
jgi:hypothetical protein